MAKRQDGEPRYRRVKDAWYVWHGGDTSRWGSAGRATGGEAWGRLLAVGDRASTLPKVGHAGSEGDAPSPGDRGTAGHGHPRHSRRLLSPTPESGLTVAGLVDAFLADSAARVSPAAHHYYVLFLRRLSVELGERPAEAVAPHEVVEAVSRRPQWPPAHRANFLGMVQMAYRWAVRARLVANCMDGLRKPPRVSRGVSAVISADEFNRLLAHAREDTRDLLTLLWATGARPAEVAGLTAEQVRASADGVIPLASHKTSHKGKARFLVLTGGPGTWPGGGRRRSAPA